MTAFEQVVAFLRSAFTQVWSLGDIIIIQYQGLNISLNQLFLALIILTIVLITFLNFVRAGTVNTIQGIDSRSKKDKDE